MPLRQRTGGKLRGRSPAQEERCGKLRHQSRHDASPRRRAGEEAVVAKILVVSNLGCRLQRLCSRTGKRAEEHISTDGGPRETERERGRAHRRAAAATALAPDAVECADPEVARRVTGLLTRVQRASLPLS